MDKRELSKTVEKFMSHILRGVTIAVLALFLISTKQSFADVELLGNDSSTLYISNVISKNDADYLIQHDREIKTARVVLLNNSGGDVAAALTIGRLIRNNGLMVLVPQYAKCFSSCALIYIAGVSRVNLGTIGLHRPYLASSPRSEQEIERQYPVMLKNIKEYVQSMGVTDSFYQEMVNTEPSKIHLYRDSEIEKLVPNTDPTYDEIMTSYAARRYGIDTAEMRRRDKDAEQCFSLYPNDSRQFVVCSEAIRWGLSERVYEERSKKQSQCKMSDEDLKAAKEAGGRKWLDLPLALKHETCVRNLMLNR